MGIKELPLAVIDGKKVAACIRSGYCCKKSPCGFGKWNNDKTQCEYLKFSDKYFCSIAEEIVKDPSWILSPAFGAGCCSPMNSDRIKKEI